MTGQKFQLVVHGGAGTIERSKMTPEKEQEYRAGIENALRAGREILQGGGSSLNAVEAAVRVLEDDPHFNAGKVQFLPARARLKWMRRLWMEKRWPRARLLP